MCSVCSFLQFNTRLYKLPGIFCDKLLPKQVLKTKLPGSCSVIMVRVASFRPFDLVFHVVSYFTVCGLSCLAYIFLLGVRNVHL